MKDATAGLAQTDITTALVATDHGHTVHVEMTEYKTEEEEAVGVGVEVEDAVATTTEAGVDLPWVEITETITWAVEEEYQSEFRLAIFPTVIQNN